MESSDQTESLVHLAESTWLKDKNIYFPRQDLIRSIYENEMLSASFASNRLNTLEFCQYLERCLIPHLSDESQDLALMVSICAMINTKFGVNSLTGSAAWTLFNSESLTNLFNSILKTFFSPILQTQERIVLLDFLGHCVNSVEVDVVRRQVQRILGICIWTNLSEKRRIAELKRATDRPRRMLKLYSAAAKMYPEESHFVFRLLEQCLCSFDEKFIGKILDFVISCESQLPTRRFLDAVLDQMNFVVRCKRNPRICDNVLVLKLEHLLNPDLLNSHDTEKSHYRRISDLQRIVFRLCRELTVSDPTCPLIKFAVSNVSAVDNRDKLKEMFESLNEREFDGVCEELMVSSCADDQIKRKGEKIEALVSRYERKPTLFDELNRSSLYPTESVLWSKDRKLFVPRLNTQFLSLHDYLYRNFVLFQLDSNYSILSDLVDVISRMNPTRCSESGRCLFNGWSRMALPIQSFAIVDVGAPRIGEDCPSTVRADVELSLDLRADIRSEWESLRKYDVCFLLCLRGRNKETNDSDGSDFRKEFGVQCVRGCEIEGVLDAKGKVVDDTTFVDVSSSSKRTLRLRLDQNQYKIDNLDEQAASIYSNFNVIVRRNSKENNFKSVLETIRSLMDVQANVPEWIHDILLGYGDPESCHPFRLTCSSKQNEWCDWNDTFLDRKHVVDVFGNDHEIEFLNDDDDRENETNGAGFALKFVENNRIQVKPTKVIVIAIRVCRRRKTYISLQFIESASY